MLLPPLSKALRTTSSHLKRLNEIGIKTVSDFLTYFPWRYTDSSDVKRIIEVTAGLKVTVRGQIRSIAASRGFRSRMQIVRAIVSDGSGSIEAIWFNRPYLAKTLKQGSEVVLYGKAKYDNRTRTLALQNPEAEEVRGEQRHAGRIVPVYPETELGTSPRSRGKISSKWIREKLFPLLPFADSFPEYLPENIRKENKLIGLGEAIRGVHFPESGQHLKEARKRLAFDELFLLQLAALHRKNEWRASAKAQNCGINLDWELIKKFAQKLPWPLTAAQRKAIYEIINDMSRRYPMSRLLEGDTGSGKTVIAAAAALHAINSGRQACLLVPTEILAHQHKKTFLKILAPFGIKPLILTGSNTAAEKRKIKELLEKGAKEAALTIGTHALIQESVSFKNLGLAIIDEQHRFGVRQREIMRNFGSPHMLSLTATPIPRTLALVLYGDQDLSVLYEMPPGRKKILTRIVPEEKRREAYAWIADEIKKGRQAFIICPLINESKALDAASATIEFERLKKIFPQFAIGLLHGRLKSDEKDRVMRSFSENRIQILVSTSVVEVGVDVPNATIMMIEGAERFGLAQLHQFRGRVGRGSEKSYCFLFPTLQNPQILQRLGALEKYNSGFKLAEIDLELRGPGEVYGTAQSGIPDLKMAALSDTALIKASRGAAEQIINEDPELSLHLELKKKIDVIASEAKQSL